MPSFWVSNAINRWAGRISGLPAAVAACRAEVRAAWVLVVGLNESTTPPIVELGKMLVAMFNVVKVESVPLNSNNFAPRLRGDREIRDLDSLRRPGQWDGMHIAVVASSAPSHMHPHLAVVAELVRRGHRVTYLVGRHLADLARPTGADVVGYDSLLPGSPSAPCSWPDDDTAGMRMFLDDSIHVLPQVQAALDEDRPGIVLYDIGGMAGPVAADRLGHPVGAAVAQRGRLGRLPRGHGRGARADLRQSGGTGISEGVRRLARCQRHIVDLRRRHRQAAALPGADPPCHAAERRSGRQCALSLRRAVH